MPLWNFWDKPPVDPAGDEERQHDRLQNSHTSPRRYQTSNRREYRASGLRDDEYQAYWRID